MPAKQRRQTLQSPASPGSQSTAKYTNKDGSKFITVPKVLSATQSPDTSATTTMAQTSATNGQTVPNAAVAESAANVSVNRKKQKRRQKQAEQAARLAAGQALPGSGADSTQANGPQPPVVGEGYDPDETAEGDRPYYSDEDGDAYSEFYAHSGSPVNGYAIPQQTTSKSAKKKKSKNARSDPSKRSDSATPHSMNSLQGAQPSMSKEKIWNTSSQEERERIKAFWLSLGEEERRSLVKVEKDAVLKKMKEQQKHSCSCTVCGRKRVAIEEELEVLYDAYYEELEQYANHQQGDRPPPMMAASRRFGQLSGLHPPHRLPPAFNARQPSRGKIIEHFGDEEDEGDEEFSDEELDEEDYSDDEPVEEIPRNHATDFFNFGQSLTVQGGILTVADDLLKNDGKKFIEMMEQLAERRMAREEDAKEQYANGYGHPSNGGLPLHHSHGHNHPPPPDDEEYDDEEEEEEEDEEEYDSQDEDYDDDEAMDTMTEEQRMEEGRRMFQIFAARMFEQRVLSAYREKVAAERQGKLIEEEAEEAIAAELKKAKKAKDAQKKKEKAQQKKAALAAEKAKKEAEKAAEEAALRAAEEKKAEEARLRAEEKRKKREAQKKAEEEERLRKEAEKQRRLQEQRERQAELERKQREAKERERKEKEEARQKEREAKEAKEKEARERRERLEKEKKDAEAKIKAEKAAKEQPKRDEQAARTPAVPMQIQKRAPAQVPVPLPPSLQSHQSISSPHVAVATPVLPKAPTPNRQANASHREATSFPETPHVGSSTSQAASPNPSTPQQTTTSPGPLGLPGKTPNQPPFLHHPQASSPLHTALKGPPGAFPPGPFGGMQHIGMNGFQPGMPAISAGFGGRMHHDPMFQHQHFRPPNGLPLPPGMNGLPMQGGRSFSGHGPPGFQHQVPTGPLGQAFGGHKETAAPNLHSRQQSASFDKQAFDNIAPAQPIARPAPIGRPSSTVQGQRPGEAHQVGESDIDDLSNHLGSSALLDDSDEPLTAPNTARRASAVPGGMGRQSFAPSAPFGIDSSSFGSPLSPYGTWAPPMNPFGTSSLPGSSYMGGWSNTNSFGAVGGSSVRASQPRSVAVRLMLCNACKNLEGSSPDGFLSIATIRDQIERLHAPRDEPVSDKELLDLCETEGNPNNGGGYFDVRVDDDGRTLIRYEPEITSHGRPAGAPGEIGSPIVSGGMASVPRFGGPPGISAPGGF